MVRVSPLNEGAVPSIRGVRGARDHGAPGVFGIERGLMKDERQIRGIQGVGIHGRWEAINKSPGRVPMEDAVDVPMRIDKAHRRIRFWLGEGEGSA